MATLVQPDPSLAFACPLLVILAERLSSFWRVEIVP